MLRALARPLEASRVGGRPSRGLSHYFQVHLNLYMYVYTVLFNIRFTSVQEPEVREHYISAMSDIVSFHSKGLEHLEIHFIYGESCQLCMSVKCNIFLLLLCEYH